MKIELTSDEIGWVKYALVWASQNQQGNDPEVTSKEEKLLWRIVKKIEKQSKEIYL
jgi:hypothetical protein|tara:strand:- start:204 stop:371 length:168 start_codon:yes stop_codon:yes gene_type:complete